MPGQSVTADGCAARHCYGNSCSVCVQTLYNRAAEETSAPFLDPRLVCHSPISLVFPSLVPEDRGDGGRKNN